MASASFFALSMVKFIAFLETPAEAEAASASSDASVVFLGVVVPDVGSVGWRAGVAVPDRLAPPILSLMVVEAGFSVLADVGGVELPPMFRLIVLPVGGGAAPPIFRRTVCAAGLSASAAGWDGGAGAVSRAGWG